MSFIFRYYSFCLRTLLFSWLIWSFTGRSCVCLLRLWGDLRVTIFLIIRRFYFHLEFNIEWKKQSKWCYWIFFILSRWNYLFVGGIEQSENPPWGSQRMLWWISGPQGCAKQLRLVGRRKVRWSKPPMDPSLEGRGRMDGWWYAIRRNTTLRKRTMYQSRRASKLINIRQL